MKAILEESPDPWYIKYKPYKSKNYTINPFCILCIAIIIVIILTMI